MAVLAAARRKLGEEPDPAAVLAQARAALATTPQQQALGRAYFNTSDLLAATEQPGPSTFFHPSETSTIPADREADFEAWLKRNRITDLDAPDSYYDYRGAYLAGINRSPNGHFPDTFKQHGHPTFSVESQYSTGPTDGGHWEGETYIPGGRPFGQPKGEPVSPAQLRGVKVALGQEQPRLSERIAPESEGIAGTLGDMAQDVENAARGLPSGTITGLGQLVSGPLKGLGEIGPTNVPGTRSASEKIHTPAAQVAEALERATESVAGPVREFFQPEGTAGAVGETVGALGAQLAAGKALGTVQRLAREADAAKALEAETFQRMSDAPEIGQEFRANRLQTVRQRAENAAGANEAAGAGFGKLAQTERRLAAGEPPEPVTPTPASEPRTPEPAPSPAPAESVRPENGRLANLRMILEDRRGGTQTAVLSHLGGAATGAVIGGASGDDKGRVGRALTGAIAGGIAGSMLAKAAAGRGFANTGQLAMRDADVAAVLKEGAPRPSAVARVSGTSARVMAAAKSGWQKLVDDVYAVRRFGKDVGKSETLSEEASRAKGWRGFGDALVGTRKSEAALPHPTLRGAIEAAKGRESDVTALLRAERAVELDDAGKGWYLTADRQTAEAAIQKLSAIPEVRQAADQLRAFYDHLLELRYRNGLLSDAEYQAIRQTHQHYVPFIPEAETERLIGGGSTGEKLFNRTKGVRRLTEGAGGYAKVDPFQQAVEDAYRTARDVSKQRVMQAVSEIVTTEPQAASPFIREISGDAVAAARRRGEGRVIDAIVNGERKTYEILDSDLADALSKVGPTSRSILVRLFSPFAHALKAGVTILPSFGVANAERDAFFTSTAFPFSKRAALGGSAVGAGFGALADPEHRGRGALIGAGLGLGGGIMAQHALRIGRGLGHVLGNDALYQEWLREGGAGTGFFLGSRRDAATLVKKLQGTGGFRDIVNPRSWWNAVEFLNQAVEQAPRLAKYAADRAEGLSPRTAAVGSRELSVDFARGGSQTGTLRATSAFWNPNLQGKVKLASVFKSPKAWATGAAAMTAPTVALWAINKDDPEYWRRPLWERNAFWLIPIGKEDDGRTKFLKLMRPFEVGFVFASVPERLLDFSYQQDKERTLAALKDMGGQIVQGSIPVPTAVLPVAETMAGDRGYDLFRSRPIVTSDVQNLPSSEQYNLNTSGPAIGLSHLIDAATGGLVSPSPQKVEHVIRGYTGTLGSRALALGDKAGKAIGLDDRTPSTRTEPSQFDRFVTRPNDFGTDDVQAMYRRFTAGEEHYRKVQDLTEQGDEAGAMAYIQAHRKELTDYVQLKPVVQAFREVSSARRQIEQMPNVSPERKREALDKLGQLAASIAANGMQNPVPGALPQPQTMQATR